MPEIIESPDNKISKGERTRERILAAALELFAEQGFEGATMRGIAERAECSLGLAYRYFRTKEEMVLALYEWLVQATARLFWSSSSTTETGHPKGS